jgi:hypothetical protein
VQKEQILRLLDEYEQRFIASEIEPFEAPTDEVIFDVEEQLSHCYSMIPRMRELIKEDKIEKVMKWLGFLEGVFWSVGDCTLDDLNTDNRSPEVIQRETIMFTEE